MSSDLLVDISSVASGSNAGASFAQIGALVDTVTVGSASNVILLIAVMPNDITTNSTEWGMEIQFAVDDVLEGPINGSFKDHQREGCSASLCWALTGISGSTKFSLYWRNRTGTTVISTDHIRSLRVIEIGNASLLVSKTSLTADDAVNSYTDIVDLTDTQTVTASSLHILLGNLLPSDADVANAGKYRFDVQAKGLVGYEPYNFVDASNELCGVSSLWAVTGLSGSTDFAFQWFELDAGLTTSTSGGRLRSFQVIEVTQDFDLQIDQLSKVSYSHTAGYTDITGMVATSIALDSANSVLLFSACAPGLPQGDNTYTGRHYDGTTGFGGETQNFIDSSAQSNGCGHCNHMAITGLSGTHTFSYREDEIQGNVSQDVNKFRGLVMVELKETAAAGLPIPVAMGSYRQRHQNVI